MKNALNLHFQRIVATGEGYDSLSDKEKQLFREFYLDLQDQEEIRKARLQNSDLYRENLDSICEIEK